MEEFDLYRQVATPDADGFEEDMQDYVEALLDLFAESGEAAAVTKTLGELLWADLVLQYGFQFGHGSPAQWEATDLCQILFGHFPRAVSMDPKDAHEIIIEMRALIQYMGRAHKLPSADDLYQEVADDEAIEELQEALADPSLWGVAKSLVMGSQRRL